MSVTAIVGRIRRLQKLAAPPPTKAPRATGNPLAERLETARAEWRTSFAAFAEKLDIVDKEGERRKLRPNAIQSAFEVSRTGRDIVLKPRQVGLTTWELARDLWVFLTRPAVRVVVVVQTDSDHKPLRETSEKIRIMLEALEADGLRFEWRAQTVSQWVLGDAMLSIVEAGASEAKAQKQGRGGTIHRLHVTELAFFEFARETLNAILEAVPATAEVCIESTANGAAGVFYELYQGAKTGANDYTASFFRWLDQAEYRTPLAPGETLEPQTQRERELIGRYGATPEQLKWYRAKVALKGQDLVDQEYPLDEETCWLIAGRLFFDRATIVAINAKTTPPAAVDLGGALHIWKRPTHGREYVLVADPSEGCGGDPGAAIVVDRETLEHVATLHGQLPVGEMAELLARVGETYNWATAVVERNNHGAAVLLALSSPPRHVERGAYPNIFRDRDGKPGWHTNETSRAAALDKLEDEVRGGLWATPDARVTGEMLTFVVNKNGKAEAATGAHDDLVMVAAIAAAVTTRTLNYRHEEYA